LGKVRREVLENRKVEKSRILVITRSALGAERIGAQWAILTFEKVGFSG